MRKHIIILLLLMPLSKTWSQDKWHRQLDSMFNRLHIEKEDTDKVETLLYTGNLYQANNTDSAKYFYQLANILSNKLNYTQGKLRYIACMVEIIERQAQYNEALKLTQQAVAIAEKANNPNMLGGAYNNVAQIYSDKGDIEKSLLYYQKAVSVFEKMGSKWKLGIVYGNILSIYLSIEDQEKAYQYGLKAILNSREGDNDYGESIGLQSLSDVLRKMKKYDSALLLSKQQYNIGIKLNDKTYQYSALAGINRILLATNKLNGIEKNALEIEKLAQAVDDKEGVAIAKYQLGEYYFKLHNYDKAQHFTTQALAILDSNKIRSILSDVHRLNSFIALATGNKTAFQLEQDIADSLRDADVSNRILKYNQQLEAEYSLNKKQAEIDNLTKEKRITALTIRQHNTTILFLIASIGILSLLVFLYYRNSLQKNKLMQANNALKEQRIRELEQEKQLLATESVIQGQEQERHRLAKDLHDGLGSILSSTKYSFSNMKNNLIITEENVAAFEKSMIMLDKSISELRRVAHNMMPEALMKFGLDTALQDFCSGIHQSGAIRLVYQSFDFSDADIPVNKASIIYRVIQELVNNILKHASATNALIQIVRNQNILSITVEDDGKGFDRNILLNNSGIGYNNLQNRVTYLNGTLDLQTSPGNGTSIHIEIPNITA